MSLLFDIFQETRINSAQQRANRAVEKTIHLTDNTATLKRRLDVMALANQALFEVLQARLGISEEEVLQRMAEIDASDGSKDGKMAAKIVKCVKCARQVSTARQRCLYCNELVLQGPLFGKA